MIPNNLIEEKLSEWGISITNPQGTIEYNHCLSPNIECSSLYLVRHGETLGASCNEFMSDDSDNSKLTQAGISKLRNLAKEIQKYNFDIAYFGIIPRVEATKDIIMQHEQSFEALKLNTLSGINNKGWEGLSYEDLKSNSIFIEREINHNIFSKTEKGSSWGEVLYNAALTLEYINSNNRNQKILLISQGSVLRALQILLHTFRTPWEGYEVQKMYNLNSQKKLCDYGTITRII